MNYKILARPLSDSFLEIAHHKLFFIILLLIQVFFILLASFTSFYFQSTILENTVTLIDELESLNLDEDATPQNFFEQGAFLEEDLVQIRDASSAIQQNLLYWTIFLFGLFVILNGLLWYGASLFVHRRKHHIISGFTSFLVPFAFCTLLLFLAFYFLLMQFVNPLFFLSAGGNVPFPIIALLLVLLFVVYVGIPLISFSSRRTLLKKTASIIVNNIFVLISAFLVIIIAELLFLYGIFIGIEGSMAVLIGSCIGFMIVLVWSKVFLITLMKQLVHHH